MVRHFLSVDDFTKEEILKIIVSAIEIKKNPQKYSETLKGKTLMMLFEKPSLRTRLSFEAGMTQLGGHGIFYSIKDSPLGTKENISDTSKCSSRFVDVVMIRAYKQSDVEEFAEASDVPVINALTNAYHPCQILGDLQTIQEHKEKIEGLKVAFVGDANNNISHSFMHAAAIVGFDLMIACPKGKDYEPWPEVLEKSLGLAKKTGAKISVTQDPVAAVKDADVVVTDSLIQYHIPPEQLEERAKIFKPYQVNADLVKHAKPDYIFMHCLPAMRDKEMTAEIIDGKNSVVFDEAENRLHIQKAIMLFLLGKL